MKWDRVGGAAGVVLLLGACEVHVREGSAPPPPPRPPPPPQQAAAAPRPPPPHVTPPAPAPAPAAAAPEPRVIVLKLPGRIVHPAPSQNIVAHLNVAALKLKLRPNRKCGPRESTPGHWIHIDCNEYTAVTAAKPFSPRKIHLLLAGGLKLDTPPATSLPDAVDHRNDGTEGPVKDQGQVGSCTAFSLSSAMDNAIRRQNKPDTMSSLHIWSHYGYPDMKTAGDGTVNKEISTWETWPYDERAACELDKSGDGDCGPYTPPAIPGGAAMDPMLQAKIKDSDSKGHWKVSEYDEVTGDPDTIASILAMGSDVWFSMNIGSTWMSLQGDTIADWTNAQVEGGTRSCFPGTGTRMANGNFSFTTAGARTGARAGTLTFRRTPSSSTSSIPTRWSSRMRARRHRPRTFRLH